MRLLILEKKNLNEKSQVNSALLIRFNQVSICRCLGVFDKNNLQQIPLHE